MKKLAIVLLALLSAVFFANQTAYAQNISPVAAKFGPVVKEFYITLPEKPAFEGKTTGKQLESFIKKHDSSVGFHYALTKKNFPDATDKLVPGTSYVVRLIPLLGATGDDCLTYINATHGLFIGTQAFAVMKESADQVPAGTYLISFDKKDKLWSEKDLPTMTRVPGMIRTSDGRWDFGLGIYESQNIGMGQDSYLICFYEIANAKP